MDYKMSEKRIQLEDLLCEECLHKETCMMANEYHCPSFILIEQNMTIDQVENLLNKLTKFNKFTK